ncbi:glycosyltransferase family 92 protein [Salibaculum halophilum]|uniref:glycosyltransferase family 92 protein n=1 Tax=Salibaculum halophilum TaxID=1914408 RepID=UPI000A1011CA|nr:glycosyltransferase family 92 protein [Salibaculum halophilum]
MLEKLAQKLKISKLGIRAPTPAPSRNGVAIAAIVRDEAEHIGEWARFHLAAGVRHFVIYDDASRDDTVEVLRATLPADRLTIIPWAQRLSDIRLGREIHNQLLAYAHAAGNFGGGFRWMGFIDIDEFLVPVGADTLEDALATLGDVPNLSLPWHMFAFSGHDTPPVGGVVSNYLMRARDPMGDAPGLRAFKMLVDPCRLTTMRIHAMQTDGDERTWNAAGVQATFATRDQAGFYSTQAVQLNHYYTRSREELESKIARGPNLLAKGREYRRKVMRTVASIEQDQVEDTRARDFARSAGLRVAEDQPTIG